MSDQRQRERRERRQSGDTSGVVALGQLASRRDDPPSEPGDGVTRQAAFVMSFEIAMRVAPFAIREIVVAWPKGVRVLDALPCRPVPGRLAPDIVVLVGGDGSDDDELPADGAEIVPVFTRASDHDGWCPVFERFGRIT